MENSILDCLVKNKITDINKYYNVLFDTDIVVLGTGISQKNINVVAAKLLKIIKDKYGKGNIKLCGYNTSWIIIDFEMLLLHLMLSETRNIYNLESLYEKNL